MILWHECENFENKKILEIERSSESEGSSPWGTFVVYFCHTICKVNDQLCSNNWYFLLQLKKKLTILKIISNSYAIINYQDKAKNKITEHNSQTLLIAFKLATYVLFLLGLLFWIEQWNSLDRS